MTAQTYQAWSNSASFHILTDAAGANLPATASETNFPVLLRLNGTFFNFGQAKANGDDLRFSTGAGGSLAYQIEQSDAVSASSGAAVFNSANGYLSVFHLNETVKDEVGTLTPSDTGTSVATGMIGKGRNFTKGKGINCGESITNYPTGNSPSTTEAWFRAGAANADIVCWGSKARTTKCGCCC